MVSEPKMPPDKPKARPFRRAVVRGLALATPPLLTIVIFLWAWNTINSYVLKPMEALARQAIVWSIRDVKEGIPEEIDPDHLITDDSGRVVKFRYEDEIYARPFPEEDKWIPLEIRDTVRINPGEYRLSTTESYYHRYVQLRFLRRVIVIPVFLCVFVLLLYFLGKFLAAGMGRFFWNIGEGVIHRLPVIRNVYSSAKQVTDFVFSEREVQYHRVVAVEYPRKGVWSLGFVTGESMWQIQTAVNEPVLSVLMPTSPMPATGFTITVPKRETIELDMTIDQAIQFIVSCGVVIPPHQQKPDDIVDPISPTVTAAFENKQSDDIMSRLSVSTKDESTGDS